MHTDTISFVVKFRRNNRKKSKKNTQIQDLQWYATWKVTCTRLFEQRDRYKNLRAGQNNVIFIIFYLCKEIIFLSRWVVGAFCSDITRMKSCRHCCRDSRRRRSRRMTCPSRKDDRNISHRQCCPRKTSLAF